MNGKIVAGSIVLTAAVAGVAMYWLQEYAYYHEASFKKGNEIELTSITSGKPEPIVVSDLQGIDANASPLWFRACFTTPLTQAMLTETYKVYDGAEPLNGPGWFNCFDAASIGAALETGEAIAFLSQSDIAPDIDRVVAVFPDGRAYAWHQVNPGVEQ